MDPTSSLAQWPGEPAAVALVRRGGQWRTVFEAGDLDAVRPWASVTKVLAAMAAAVDLEAGHAELGEPLGPPGATLEHLLSHASGLGFEAGDPVVAPGTKRVYSNLGIDLAASRLRGELDVASWLRERVLAPLSLASVRVPGEASAGAVGSARDLATFATQWVTSDLISGARRDQVVTNHFGDLVGVVPGFGRFTPCPWGLGVQIRGASEHWMGQWPSTSFGHFGRSGAMVLVDLEGEVVLAATSDVDFAAWSREIWPDFTTAVHHVAMTS